MIITPAFEKFRDQAWPYRFATTWRVSHIVGGTPSDPDVGLGFIKSKMAGSDALIQETVAQMVAERGMEPEVAAREADKLRHLNGFLRDETGLYHPGRCIKACIKEATSVAFAAGKLIPTREQRASDSTSDRARKAAAAPSPNADMSNSWGRTHKGILGFVAEHVCVPSDPVHFTRDGKPILEADLVTQKFVHTFQGNGIQYEEVIIEADLSFTIYCDYPFTEEQWAMVLLTAERQGTGASRSQGQGQFIVTEWQRL
jgi:hypothetical protein